MALGFALLESASIQSLVLNDNNIRPGALEVLKEEYENRGREGILGDVGENGSQGEEEYEDGEAGGEEEYEEEEEEEEEDEEDEEDTAQLEAQMLQAPKIPDPKPKSDQA